MPVYNGAAYLREAVDSLLQQTFTDFELLVIDDGSTDDSARIIQTYTDARIRFEQNPTNLGLITTLNKGNELALGQFIARMDCDDISLPNRLERQIQYLEQNPEVGLVGSWFEKRQGAQSVLVKTPVEHELIRFYLIFDNTFLHSSIVFRRSILQQFNLHFDPDFPYAEDYELWARMSRLVRVANIPEVLVQYRDHADNTSHRYRREQQNTADRIRRLHLASLGLEVDESTVEIHLSITNFRWQGNLEQLHAARIWLETLATMGHSVLKLPEGFLYRSLDRYWYGVCAGLAGEGLRVWFRFLASPLGRHANPVWIFKLLLRCVFRHPVGQTPA